jgi:hypothetical protein
MRFDRALPCRLQDTEEDPQVIGQVVQRLPQGFTSVSADKKKVQRWASPAERERCLISMLFSVLSTDVLRMDLIVGHALHNAKVHDMIS